MIEISYNQSKVDFDPGIHQNYSLVICFSF